MPQAPVETMKTNIRSVPRTKSCAALFATLLCVTLLPACSTKPKPTTSEVAVTKLDELETSVRAVVTDPARANKVVALLGELQTIVVAQNKALVDHDRRTQALLTDYATSGAVLRREFDSFNAGRNERTRRAVEIVTQARAATTAAEWSALDKARADALNAVSNATRQP
jgi:hypothetical protein